MFVRLKTAKQHTYLQIVENRRIEGKTRQEVLCNLGRVDTLAKTGLADGLLQALVQFSDKFALLGDLKNQTPADCRRIGAPRLFERLWKEMSIGDVINQRLAQRKFDFPVERTIFTAVLQRLLNPGSDRSAMAWRENYCLIAQEDIDLQHFYRAMAWLGTPLPESEQKEATPFSPRCEKDCLEELLFAKRRNLFSSLEMVFFDTTSIYFQGEGGQELGRFGFSKDHRPDCHQIVVGMILDNEGYPVCTEIWPGNTADVSTLIPVAERLKKRFHIEKICIVADRGMVSKETMEKVKELGWNYILGVRMRRDKIVREKVMTDTQPFQTVTPERTKSTDPSPLKVKNVMLDESRFIVCKNDEQARKDIYDREQIVAKLEKTLAYYGDKALIGNKGFRSFVKKTNAVGENGPCFAIDHDKVESESLFDGIWVLDTSINTDDMKPEDVAKKYKQLLLVEDIFRQTKSLLSTRPIYHKRDETIRGHVWISFLALLLRKELQDRLEKKRKKDEPRLGWAEIIDGLESLQEVEVAAGGKRYLMRSNSKPAALRCYQVCGLAFPPVIKQIH